MTMVQELIANESERLERLRNEHLESLVQSEVKRTGKPVERLLEEGYEFCYEPGWINPQFGVPPSKTSWILAYPCPKCQAGVVTLTSTDGTVTGIFRKCKHCARKEPPQELSADSPALYNTITTEVLTTQDELWATAVRATYARQPLVFKFASSPEQLEVWIAAMIEAGRRSEPFLPNKPAPPDITD